MVEKKIKLCPVLKTMLLHGGNMTPQQMGCPLSWVFKNGDKKDSNGAKNIMHELVIGLLRTGWEKHEVDTNCYVLTRGMEKVKLYRNNEDIIVKYKKAEPFVRGWNSKL